MSSLMPEKSYGILEREACDTKISAVVEQVRRLGYGVLDAGMSNADVNSFMLEFDLVRNRYIQHHGLMYLESIDEHYTLRMPLLESEAFRLLASNAQLHLAVKELIKGNYILNQQNGIINPPNESYNQAAWHRDLPYQHYTSSRPLAINALYCVDDFTRSNGSTFAIPGSHLHEAFPSTDYVRNHAVQVEAPAGSFLVLDCMLYHCGGFNNTSSPRRAVNHLFTIPFFKQQISLGAVANIAGLTDFQTKLFGVDASEPQTVDEYLARRKPRN